MKAGKLINQRQDWNLPSVPPWEHINTMLQSENGKQKLQTDKTFHNFIANAVTAKFGEEEPKASKVAWVMVKSNQHKVSAQKK